MSTNFQRLECSKGCQLDRVKFLAEAVYKQQDEAFNVLSAESIELVNFLHEQVMPYLHNRAETGDAKAQDLLIDLTHLV